MRGNLLGKIIKFFYYHIILSPCELGITLDTISLLTEMQFALDHYVCFSPRVHEHSGACLEIG